MQSRREGCVGWSKYCFWVLGSSFSATALTYTTFPQRVAKQGLCLKLLQGPLGTSPKGNSSCCTATLIAASRGVWGKGRASASPRHHRLGRAGHSLHSKAVPFQLGPFSLSLLPSTRQGKWGRKERWNWRDLLTQVFRSPVVWCICWYGKPRKHCLLRNYAFYTVKAQCLHKT